MSLAVFIFCLLNLASFECLGEKLTAKKKLMKSLMLFSFSCYKFLDVKFDAVFLSLNRSPSLSLSLFLTVQI